MEQLFTMKRLEDFVPKPRQSRSPLMATLECYEPSLVAWSILSRTANVLMTVDDEDAISVMKRLANPRASYRCSCRRKWWCWPRSRTAGYF
ncbi:hypothetical protein ABIB73_003293 [Bradyrhizobium sp. F1.4.3]